MQKKDNRGGAGRGQGRKSKGLDGTIVFNCPPSMKKSIEDYAQSLGFSLSEMERYIMQRGLEIMPEHQIMPTNHTIRVYRDDNSFYEESEYVAVVDNKDCYLANVTLVSIPEWKKAIIQFLHPLKLCPNPGLLNNTATALGGWHFLLDSNHGDINAVQDWQIVESHKAADVVIAEVPGSALPELPSMYSPHYRRIGDEREKAFNYAKAILQYIGETIDPEVLARYLLRFSLAQLREAIGHLSAGRTVEFRFHEYGSPATS